jgi:hypothetical protein
MALASMGVSGTLHCMAISALHGHGMIVCEQGLAALASQAL